MSYAQLFVLAILNGFVFTSICTHVNLHLDDDVMFSETLERFSSREAESSSTQPICVG